jgi:hypothetical protein
VIAEDQPLFPVQTLQDRLRFPAAEEHIAHYTNGVCVLYPAVPVLNDRLVHCLYRLKRTIAELQHVSVAEMRVGYKVKHSTPPSVVFCEKYISYVTA